MASADHLAVHLEIEDATEGHCQSRAYVQGQTRSTAAPVFHGADGEHVGSIVFSNPMVHAGDASVDSQDVFALSYGYTSPWVNVSEGSEQGGMTLVAAGVDDVDGISADGAGAPLVLSVRCEGEPNLQAWAGAEEVFPFSDEAFEEGIGARSALVPVGGSTHAAAASAWSATTSTERTIAVAQEETLPEPRAAAGQLELEGPDGSQSRSFGAERIDPIWIHHGSAGDYAVHLTRVSLEGPTVHGFVAGLVHVGSIEALEAWIDAEQSIE